LLAQIAEHLERRRSLTPAIMTRCREAISLIPMGDAREKVEALLSDVCG
jgi:hypothetical protein